MKFTPDDGHEDHQSRPREWSAVMLWVSVFVSINIVFGTITWNFARRIHHERQLQAYATRSCTDLLKTPDQVHAPTSAGPKAAGQAESCEAFVEAHHDTCLDQALRLTLTQDVAQHGKLEQHVADEYVTCLMSLPHDQRFALTSPPR